MKVKLIGKNLDDVRPLLAGCGMEESDAEFELVVAHGGDGTLFIAEHDFPGVPKLPLRDSGTAPVCPLHDQAKQLSDFAAGKLPLSRLPKLEARTEDGGRISGINDIFVHNLERVSALRYNVFIDGALYAREIVGDGVGMATVHGSTAYYKSITHSIFRTGVGLAFSNSTEEVNHLVLAESSVVEIEIVRGPAMVAADNSADRLYLTAGDRVKISLSGEYASVYALENFMCRECRKLRHSVKYR